MIGIKTREVVQWFGYCGDRFVETYRRHIDVPKLTEDKNYGLKVFLFDFAFARNGAPHAFRVAGVKAVSACENPNVELKTSFKDFWTGKCNKQGNPVFDPNLRNLDIPEIVKLVKDGALCEAFRKLKLRGVGHKIGSLFLRDLVILLGAEPKLTEETYRYCQPIDIWVRIVVGELCGTHLADGAAKYRLNPGDLAAVDNITQLSLKAGVSPLKVNAGIWYFSSNIVADRTRLRKLFDPVDVRRLKAESELMEGFLPT